MEPIISGLIAIEEKADAIMLQMEADKKSLPERIKSEIEARKAMIDAETETTIRLLYQKAAEESAQMTTRIREEAEREAAALEAEFNSQREQRRDALYNRIIGL